MSRRPAPLPPRDERLRDFRLFLYLLWKHLNLPEPTKRQREIAYRLQHGPDRDIIQAFRGCGKSWLTSGYVLWRAYWDPETRFLVVSASKARADDFSTFLQRLVREFDLVNFLAPSDNQRDSKISFDFGPASAAHAPSVKSVGVTGQMTGSRANVIIADDVEVVGNSSTQVQRDKLREIVKEFDAVLSPGGKIVYLGTPQVEDSLYNTLLSRGYSTFVVPARYPTEKQSARMGEKLSPSIAKELKEDPSLAGRPTDPDRFDDIDLTEREASYGRSGFALQFMLDTSLSDADRYPLKLSDLLIHSVDPDVAPERLVWAASPDLICKDLPMYGMDGDRLYRPMARVGELRPYQGSVMAIDPAGRGKDETGVAVVKFLNSTLWVPVIRGYGGAGGHGYSDEVLETLAKTAKAHKVTKILVEANFGDGMFSKLLQPYLQRIYPCTLEEVKHSIQKERRIIDILEPVMNQHRLVLDPQVIEEDSRPSHEGWSPEEARNYRFAHQLTRLTKERGALIHDDRLDALSIAVAFWTQQMALEQGSSMAAAREEALQRDLEKFMGQVLGRPQQAPERWLVGSSGGGWR